MELKRQSNGQRLVFASASTLAVGGEARIYRLSNDNSLVAKVYHRPSDERARKLEAMIANPPDNPSSGAGHVPVAWPVDLLLTADGTRRIAGFLMPYVADMRLIIDFYLPKSRHQYCPLFNHFYLHRTARNLAGAVRALHARGYVIGDVNESNILVSENALVTLVDTDSFQVSDPRSGAVFRCLVGKPEFTPPEIQRKLSGGMDFSRFDRAPEHDLFALAVILFQLLMEGTHPFAGAPKAQGDPPAYEARISAGHFPYARRATPYRPMRLAPPFEILHPALRDLFLRCFEDGHHRPSLRPNVSTWIETLSEAEAALAVCPVNDQHRYGSHLSICPWCQRRDLLGGHDPFPPKPAPRRTIRPQPPAAGSNYTETHAGLDLEMVWIAGGTFRMGSDSAEAQPDEQPVHDVALDGFWLGKYLVTQRQHEALIKGVNWPVLLSWDDAVEFCRKLSNATGRTYTLPTEAQWEYACRAGSTTDYCFGDAVGQLGDYAWFSENSGRQPHKVGGKKPNAWGLYDMHGNVWEWCSDWHGETYYASQDARQRNPVGPSSGRRGTLLDGWPLAGRVLRGGSYRFSPQFARSARREYANPTTLRSMFVLEFSPGFRVCRPASP